MEVVRVFNNELSSLYEVKPPISKAKMTQITKSAIKGIKFYKHIVQSVEKFIQKCRPEYKVPGLYVVDSIVRQSRHQFGAEKDVFGPRFVKNITTTFQHLFKCAEEDRPKIIRVLNLWQKNSVFPIDVIQPLLDMGHPNTSNEWSADAPADTSKNSPAVKVKEEPRHKPSDSWKGWPQAGEEPIQETKVYAEMSTKNLEKFNKAEMSNAVKEEEASRSSAFKNQVKAEKTPEETVKFNKKLLDFDYGDEEDEEEAKNEESHLSTQPNALALSMAQNLLSNPELLRQLQQMTASTIQQNESLKEVSVPSHQIKSEENDTNYSQDMQSSSQLPLIPPAPYQQPISHNMHLSKSETDTDDRVLPEPPLPARDLDERSLASVMASHDRLLPSMCLPAFQQTGLPPKPPLPDKDDRLLPDPTPVMPPQDLDERSLASLIAPPDRAPMPPVPYSENSSMLQFQFDKNGVPYQTQPPMPPMMEPLGMDSVFPPVMPPDTHLLQNSQGDEDERMMFSMPGEPPLPPQDFDERQIMLPVEERSRKDRSRSRSGSRSRGRGSRRRSRSRSPRRKRSRSRSHSRKNRSRSRERERERIREKERERERERERRRKGIPPIKKGCVSVCSTTLWLGHVPKSCSEVDISDTFGPFGTILSIDMIPPRGCAYVVMDRRQDGYKALQKLKNVKLQGSSIKMAWAPGKGVKGKEYKDFWEVELGVSYIPYEKIKDDPDILDMLEEGGFIDEDSLPEHLKALRKQPDEEKHPYNDNNKAVSEANATYTDIPSTPNMVPPPIMPPTSVNIPMVLPHLMQPQFGLHLPGMLPPQAMVMQVPMGIPPPAPMLMVQQQSQGILSNQPLSMVGGVPQIVPRTIPPATNTLPNLKNAVQPESTTSLAAVPPTTIVGDATPTEEEGTNVSSPSVQMSIPCSVSASAVPPASSQPIVSMPQFNPILGLTANRPMLSVPPPVSTAGAPIPYPPPNMGFNFPPPGIRPPGQAHTLPPNPQFPWMQKQVGSPFTDTDSSQSNTPVRPVPPPQPGMPAHMFGNRLPFHDPQSSVNSSPMKDLHKGRDNVEQKPSDVDSTGNRNSSPGHHDKMIQEMVISTDDESSMDIEYPRNEMPAGPCYPGAPDFPRTPMNMQRMRGPPGPMPPGPRFRGMPMGSPFPMRMGGPRGMGGAGMHNRMDMEFPPHHGSRGPGPRMPLGPHGPRRNDMHPPHDGRDWYPRDFEGPPYERERDRPYRDDWGREPWDQEGDGRHNTRDHDESRRDEHRDSWNRDRSDTSKSSSRDASRDSSSRDANVVNNNKNESAGRQKDKPSKNRNTKSLMEDLLKLRGYQRGRGSFSKSNRTEQPKDKPIKNDDKHDGNEAQKPESNIEHSNSDKEIANDQNVTTKKDRESRKRSRWGRTLSEERELQEQKRNEIELKRCEVEKLFQSYEQSHVAQQPPQASVNPLELSDNDKTDIEQPMESVVNEPEPNIVSSAHSTVDMLTQNELQTPVQSEMHTSIQSEMNTPVQNEMCEPMQNDIHLPQQHEDPMSIQNDINRSNQNESCMPPQNESCLPPQNESCMPLQGETGMPLQKETNMPLASETLMPMKTETCMPVQTETRIPLQSETCMPLQNETHMPMQNEKEINAQINFASSGQKEESVLQNSFEIHVQNSPNQNVLTDPKIPTGFCTDLPHTGSSSASGDVVDNISHVTDKTENIASSCDENVGDLNVNSVTKSISNENNVVEEDLITSNSALVSTES